MVDRWWRVEVEIMVMVKVTIAVKLWMGCGRMWAASCGPAVADCLRKREARIDRENKGKIQPW